MEPCCRPRRICHKVCLHNHISCIIHSQWSRLRAPCMPCQEHRCSTLRIVVDMIQVLCQAWPDPRGTFRSDIRSRMRRLTRGLRNESRRLPSSEVRLLGGIIIAFCDVIDFVFLPPTFRRHHHLVASHPHTLLQPLVCS